MDRFAGKRVLVTGGALRVGAAICRAFAGAGAKVIVHYRNSEQEAQDLCRSLPGDGHGVIQCDLADTAAVRTLFAKIGKPVDILINNASHFERPVPPEEETPEFIDRCFRVNATAPVLLMQQFAAQDLAAEGVIINLLDQAAEIPQLRGGAYLASRRELRAATLEFALNCAPRIRVNGVAPGAVLPPAWMPESRMEKTIPTIPLLRTATVEDLTDTVLFLAGNRSITGTIVCVDAGQHLNFHH